MRKTNFADVLDAAGSLPVDEREELVELLHKRAIDERRTELSKDIKNARADYKNRKYSAASAKDMTATGRSSMARLIRRNHDWLRVQAGDRDGGRSYGGVF